VNRCNTADLDRGATLGQLQARLNNRSSFRIDNGIYFGLCAQQHQPLTVKFPRRANLGQTAWCCHLNVVTGNLILTVSDVECQLCARGDEATLTECCPGNSLASRSDRAPIFTYLASRVVVIVMSLGRQAHLLRCEREVGWNRS